MFGVRVSDAWVRFRVSGSRFSYCVYRFMLCFPHSPFPLNIYPFTLPASHISGFGDRVSRLISRVLSLICTVPCYPFRYSGFRSSGLKSQVPGFGFDIPGFEGYPRKRVTPRIPSARTIFLASDWIFRVSGVTFRASGFSSDISGFGSETFGVRF